MRQPTLNSWFFGFWILFALSVTISNAKGQEVFTLGLNGDLWSIDPNPCLGTFIGNTGHYMVAKMTGATPNSQVMLMWAKGRGGPSPIPNGLPCSGTMMNLNSNLSKVAIVDTDANGEAVVGPGPRRVPSSAAGLIWFQAIDLSNCSTSNRIQLRY